MTDLQIILQKLYVASEVVEHLIDSFKLWVHPAGEALAAGGIQVQAVLEEDTVLGTYLRHGAQAGIAVGIEHDEGIVGCHFANGFHIFAEGLAGRGIDAFGERLVGVEDVLRRVNLCTVMDGKHDDNRNLREAVVQTFEESVQSGIEGYTCPP